MAEKTTSSDEAGGGGELVLSPHPSTKPKIDLRNAEAIRRELGAVYRDARSGRIPTQDATRLGYLLNLLRMAVETGELQARIEQIERHFERGTGGTHAAH